MRLRWFLPRCVAALMWVLTPPVTAPPRHIVGGGIVAVIPGRGALSVWRSAIDRHGNSVAGVTCLDTFTTFTGWSVFQ